MLERHVVVVVVGPDEPPATWRELAGHGWHVHEAAGWHEAAQALCSVPARVALLWLPGAADPVAAEVQSWVLRHPALECVAVFDTSMRARPPWTELAVHHLFDHHTAPVDWGHLAFTLGHADGRALLRATPRPPTSCGEGADGIIGRSAAVELLRQRIVRAAKVSAPVLVTGESGTGKELAARALHRASPRHDGPFVEVDCGAMAQGLLQSELFGHVKGAFTGAARDRRGYIEEADGGTLFLDEVGDLPLELQTNLLRFLQEGTLSRVGTTRTTRVDARVVAATHVDLEEAVRAGRFRKDLYYRLNVVPLQVPPLRERRDDIELLAHHVYERYADERNPAIKGFSRQALAAMHAHDWPGNVRELVNRVRRAMALGEGRLITPEDLGLRARGHASVALEALDEVRVVAERSAIFSTLQQVGSNVSEAARRLGVSRMTLYRLMAKHQIEP